ncbi:MAG: flagellar basal body-associated FliL family protein [Desulfohalobiaceae bacterium]
MAKKSNNNVPEQKEQGEQDKVQLDEQEVDESASRAAQKVELDLDDAPFLEWEEDEPEQEQRTPAAGKADSSEPAEAKQEQKTGPVWWKRRLVWLIAGVCLLLLLALVPILIWQKDAPQKESRPDMAIQPEHIPVQAGQARQRVHLEPFWVEHNQEDQVRFLHLEFALALDDKDLAREIDRKTPALRDAVYYYLRKKELVFLANEENVDQLKSELTSLLNQYLSQGQVQEVLIQDYLVQ